MACHPMNEGMPPTQESQLDDICMELTYGQSDDSCQPVEGLQGPKKLGSYSEVQDSIQDTNHSQHDQKENSLEKDDNIRELNAAEPDPDSDNSANLELCSLNKNIDQESCLEQNDEDNGPTEQSEV